LDLTECSGRSSSSGLMRNDAQTVTHSHRKLSSSRMRGIYHAIYSGQNVKNKSSSKMCGQAFFAPERMGLESFTLFCNYGSSDAFLRYFFTFAS
jgi:hypothetical protein